MKGFQKIIKPVNIDHREFGLDYNVRVFYLRNKHGWETFRPHEDCFVLYSVKIQFAVNRESNSEILFPACPLLYVVRCGELDYDIT